MSVVLLGCASVWQTATPPHTALPPTPTKVLRSTSSAGIQRTPIPTPQTTAPLSAQRAAYELLSPLTVTQALVQFWMDPNDVNGLFYDGTHLWATTSGGLVRWQPTTGEGRLYTTRDGLASLAVRGIAQDADGHLWVGYAGHPAWSEYDGETWRSYDTREAAVAQRHAAMRQARHFDSRLWSYRAGSKWLWLPTVEGRVKAYDGQAWRTYGEAEGVTRGTWLVAVSRAGRVWAAGQGISTAEEGERWWQDHSLPSGASAESQVMDLAVDAQERVWVALVGPSALDSGVSYLDLAAKRWTSFHQALDPVIPRQVYGLDLAADGTLWLCGEDGIVSRRPGQPWQTLPLPGLTVQTFILDPRGGYWVGTPHGVYRVAANGADWRGPWRWPAPFVGNEIVGLAVQDTGRLWIGTTKGLFTADATGSTRTILSERPSSLVRSPTGQLWLGARSGLYALQGDGTAQRVWDQPTARVACDAAGIPWVYAEDGRLGRLQDGALRRNPSVVNLAGDVVQDFALDAQGVAWLATTAGVGVLAEGGQFTTTVRAGLPDRDVRALAFAPDGTLWAGTANGLARRAPSGGWVVFTTASTEGGLRAMEIWDLALDAQGTLWIVTAAGVSLRTKEADWSYVDLPGARVVWPEPSGAVWIGTLGGLYRIQRDAFTRVP